MWVLVKGLPPEAAVWRQHSFAPTEELLVQLLERHDQWARAHLQALLHHKKISVPPEFRLLRPGEEDQPMRKIETDPGRIAAFFSEHVSD